MSDLPNTPVSPQNAPVSPRQKSVSLRRSRFEQRLSASLFGVLERASWASCRRLGAGLGWAFFAVGRKRRELAIDNVQMALGFNRAQATRIARRSAQNWGMTTCEFLHLPGASAEEIRAYVSLQGLEELQTLLQQGNGVIILMAHLGNWELLAARLSQEMNTAAIVRSLSNLTAQKHLTDVRRGTGLEVISKHSAARPALKWLQNDGALCILPDRHAGPDGTLLPLFGRDTRFEGAPARLALASGAPIVPVWSVRREPWLQNGRIEAQILPPFWVRSESRETREAATVEGTREVIRHLETVVRAHPDQWSWMLRRWRDIDTA